MRIENFDIFPYTLPLSKPVRVRGRTLEERRGLLLRIDDGAGSEGWGDAAPLPGLSRETFDQAKAHLEALLPVLSQRSLRPEDTAQSDSPLHSALDAAGIPPSSRFAVDLALVDMASSALNVPLTHLLDPEPAPVLAIAGLITEAGEEAIEQARAFRHAGYQAVKVKVGSGEIEDDLELLREVRHAVGPATELRADANCAWSIEDAKAFARGANELRLAYVEEPLAQSHLLPTFWAETQMAIGLDETLSATNGAEWVRSWTTAAVLKPTALGGLAATMRLAARARRHGVRPVLSSAYESGVALRGIAALAAVTGAEPAGLGTYKFLTDDVLAERLPLEASTVDLPVIFSRPVQIKEMPA